MEKNGEPLVEHTEPTDDVIREPMDDAKQLTYFDSLVGKQVRVYREGPECKVGKLLAAKPDYIVVKTLEDQVVYYQTYHINSINQEPEVKKPEPKEDAKMMRLAPMPEVEEVSYLEAENFADLLKQLQYKAIQIDRNGPESRCGLLLDVKSDYLVILTKKDGVVFYPFFHIRSISEYPMENLDIEYPKNIPANSLCCYSQAETFSEALSDFIGHHVQINRGGPESRRGQIVSVNPNFMALQNSLDSLYIYVNHHIRNISEMPMEKDNTNSNKKDSTKSTQKDNTNSKKNKAQNSEESDIINLLTNLVKLDVNSFDEFARRMVNQKIYVYTVGHEPIEGYLTNLTLNYLVVRDGDSNFICCNTEHIKVFQIRFDAERRPHDGVKPDGFKYEAFKFLFKSAQQYVELEGKGKPAAVTPFSAAVESFAQLISTIKDSNSYTKINSGAAGVASIAAQKEDFVALQTEDKLVLYNPSHIKSFTVFSDPERIQKKMAIKANTAWEYNYQPLLQVEDFKGCLNGLKHQWIQINRYGPAKTDGMLLEIFDDYFTLFSKQKIYRIPFHQVHDICLGKGDD